MGHTKESVAESVALRARYDFHTEVTFGYRHGDASHFFEVGDHIIERGGQGTYFVVAMNVDVLIEVAGIANFARHGDEVGERFADGLGGLVCSPDAEEQSNEGTEGGHTSAYGAGVRRGRGSSIQRSGDVGTSLVQNHG